MEIFTPFKFNSGVTINNRLLMAPITNAQSMHDGQVTQDEIEFYQKRARGLGAVIVAAANVTPSGKGWFGELSLTDDKFIPNLQKLTAAIHDQGAKAFIQIFHVGRLGKTRIIGDQPIAPSPVMGRRPGSEMPREMIEAEIQEIITGFGEATRRAIEAGFDGVEIHGANGYLIQEFFSSHGNNRTDRWGGDQDSRFSFPKAVIESVLKARDQFATKPFNVGYRFSPEEFGGGGIQMENTLWLLDQLTEFPLDYLHISLDDAQKVSKNPKFSEHPILHYLHQYLNGRLPLIGVGGVRTRADLEKVLEDAELVAIAHQLIMDPTWPVKLAENRDADLDLRPLTTAVEDADVTPTFYDYLINRFVRIGLLPKERLRK